MKHTLITAREWRPYCNDFDPFFEDEDLYGSGPNHARNHLERMKREDPAKYADRLREWE